METVFIAFISTFLALIFFCVLLYKLIKTKGITLRDNVVVLLTSSFVLILGSTITSGEKINEKIKTTYSISKEFDSPEDVQDALINDSILSNYLQKMRVPHYKIVLAQAKLESGNYKSELYKSNFNLFGMKVVTRRVTNSTSSNNGYQSYCNWRESVMDYVLWQFTNKVDKLTQDEYLDYLSQKYAEDPKYVIKLKEIINNLN